MWLNHLAGKVQIRLGKGLFCLWIMLAKRGRED
jgi:hypothetical protein